MAYKRKTKTCRNCRVRKLYCEFYTTDNGCGQRCFKSICKVCDNKTREKRLVAQHKKFGKSLARKKREKLYLKKRALLRRIKENWHKEIYVNSRRSDKAKKFRNNLTKEFIENKISKGCSYCGEKRLRMTLDRIDNNRGHTRKNVRSACIRCNYARRDMPYAAWLHLVPRIKEARKRGLFGRWTGRIEKRKRAGGLGPNRL